jgi:predicted secreted protein
MKFTQAITALFLLLTPITSARAGDAATVEVLGFSQSGDIFAFEEYGIQDGSGFPYANRFYIDTNTDTFLPGTPARVRLDDENARLDDARAKARAIGEKIVKDAELAEHRGFTAGANAVTELNADPFRIVVNPRPVFPPIDPPLEFRLEEIPLAGPSMCESQGPVAGFRLVQINAKGGGVTKVLHEDTDIPAGRRCPKGYRIGSVQTYFDGGKPAYAVLIAVEQYGFEGPDFRWIAVTGRL